MLTIPKNRIFGRVKKRENVEIPTVSLNKGYYASDMRCRMLYNIPFYLHITRGLYISTAPTARRSGIL